MRTRRWLTLACVVLSLLAGCDDLAPFAQEWATVAVPAEIPAEVETVLADSARYSATDHPLQGMVPGSKIVDDLDELTGCWGSYRVLRLPTPQGVFVDVALLSIWSVNTDTRTVTEYSWSSSLPEFGISQPLLGITSGTYQIVDARRIAVEVFSSESALVADDGTLYRHPVATLLGVVPLNERFEMFVTLDGHYMKQTEATGVSLDDLVVEDIDDWSYFYTRMDCAAD